MMPVSGLPDHNLTRITMSYTVLARRYRSVTFDDVVGQNAVAKTLKNAIETDRVAHAYLFTGTRGVGKTSMARILAKALNCLSFDQPTPAPCCTCDSCTAINEGEDIDVLEIDGASNTGVEHIRELRQNAIYRPARSRFKIYIIDEVHMLSTSAFNALLKTLEEPPDHVKFIMATTEPNKVLPTILSRCQRFDFRNIRTSDIVNHLQRILTQEKLRAEDALLRRVARLARGSMRDALSLLDQLLSMSDEVLTLPLLDELLGTPPFEYLIDLVEAIGRNDLPEALRQVDRTLAEGLALEQLTRALQDHFRDLMVLRHCGDNTDLVDLSDPVLKDRLKEQAQRFDDANLVYSITVMEELHRAVKSGGAGRALLEAAVVRLAGTPRFSDTKILLEQLRQISTTGARPPADSTPKIQFKVSHSPLVSTDRQMASSNPPAEPPSLPSKPPAAGVFTPPKTISLGYLQENWSAILDQMTSRNQDNLVIYLKPAHPSHWQENTLTIRFHPQQNGIQGLILSRPQQIRDIEKSLSGILQHPITLKIDQLHDTPSPSRTKSPSNPPPKSNKNPIPPGAKPSQQEINDAMKDPAIRNVQELLGGKVRHIERAQEE